MGFTSILVFSGVFVTDRKITKCGRPTVLVAALLSTKASMALISTRIEAGTGISRK